MEKIITVAHMSDLHYGPDNLTEADRCFTAAVTEAIERNVSAAVLTGDSTDHVLQAHSPSLLALARQVQRLANHCPVLMLQGTFSHEPVGLLQMFALLGAKYPVCIADRIASYGLAESGFEPVLPEKTESYRLVVHALPTLNKAELVNASMSEVGAVSSMAGNLVAQVLQSWAPANRHLRLNGIPSMVISHGTVHNCITEHGVPMAGADHEFGVGALFAAEADAVALGHIHKHQFWSSNTMNTQQLIAYAGSIGRFHHGEDGEKFWLEWHLEPGAARIEPRVTPSRRTIDLDFHGVPDLDVLRNADCAGAFVRLRYAVDVESSASVNRDTIRALLVQNGAVDVQIEGRTLVVERVRAQGISREHDIGGKLEKWAEASGNEVQMHDLMTALTMLNQASSLDQLMEQISQSIEHGLQEKTAAVTEMTSAPSLAIRQESSDFDEELELLESGGLF